MEQNYQEKKPIRATLKDMQVGDIVHFPASRTSVIRSTTSTLGLELDREYASRINRDARTIDVIRNR
jgi:hypothetical protein